VDDGGRILAHSTGVWEIRARLGRISRRDPWGVSPHDSSHPRQEDSMSDKSALLHEAERAFTELRQAIDGLDEEAMSRVWLGHWGVREILIHISGWHREAIAGFDRVARGADAPYPAGTYDDYHAWNARFVEARVGVKVADVLTELEASHRDFVAAAAAVPDTCLAPEGSLRGLLEGVGAGHYREHAAGIRQWRQATGR
jgi:hypothetical protein